MESKTFKVPAIGCDGCTKTIKSELSAMPGVKSVDAAVDTKQVSVQWEAPATWDAIEAKLTEIDYPPEKALMP
jgi:copper chaperone CopZ